jgi:hypothetical protein
MPSARVRRGGKASEHGASRHGALTFGSVAMVGAAIGLALEHSRDLLRAYAGKYLMSTCLTFFLHILPSGAFI